MKTLARLTVMLFLLLVGSIAYGNECRYFDGAAFQRKIADEPMPLTVLDAATSVGAALPSELKRNLIENDGVFTLCGPFFIENQIETIISATWNLENWNTPLSRDLVKLGLFDRGDMVGGILSLLADRLRGTKFNRDRVMQAIALSRGDAHSIDEPVPSSCVGGALANARAINIVINGYGRIISYVGCEGGTYLVYLWERGWFFPDAEMKKDICRRGAGDLPRFCKKSIK